MHRELRLICQKDNIYLKTSSKSNVGRTHHYIFKFFLKRASIYDFCCNTNQNNPHILKYDSYDRSRLLQPCGKFFSWAPPIPLGNVYPLAPPPLRNFRWPSVGGGYGYFLEPHNYFQQGAKKIIFTACHSGKLKLTFTSPDVISTSPKSFLKSRIDLRVLLLHEFLKKNHLPVGQVKNRIH